MALKNKICLAIALTTLLSMASAKAYIVPGGAQPEPPPVGTIQPLPPGPIGGIQPLPPGPIPQPGPMPQPAPMPQPQPGQGQGGGHHHDHGGNDNGGGYNPYPGNGGYNPYPGNGGGYGPYPGNNNGLEQRYIQIRRRVINENLSLLQLAGIDNRYNGYIVQSVTVNSTGFGPRSQLALIINGQFDASAMAASGPITLVPRYQAVLGQVRDIQLSVNGGVDLDSVMLTLQAPGGGGGGGWGPREITVPLAVARRMLGNDRLDLTPYIDVYQYRGMRITAIDIDANALYQVAFLDVLLNGYAQGPSTQVSNYAQRHTVYPQNAVIGQTVNYIMLNTRGDMDIRGVTLRLSRR